MGPLQVNHLERFDPGILFDDEDFPYGDSLSYELVDVLKINDDIEEH